MASRFRFFVAVSPGLESLLLDELRQLGIPGEPTPGGVDCSGTVETLWTLHWHCRLAESVRLRLRPFDARTFAELEQGLGRLPWHAYLQRGVPFDVSVTCQHSRLYHTGAIVERVRRVIDHRETSARGADVTSARGADVTSARGADVTSAPADLRAQSAQRTQKLHVRVTNNAVQVSIDASGDRLHRRGYRTHVGDAPLRETLAAATVRLLSTLTAEGEQIEKLWDPCCGSGTLLAEWLLPLVGGATQSSRNYAFELWPIHDAAAYLAWTEGQREPKEPNQPYQAFGTDRDERSIEAARHNLRLAGVADRCELLALDFRAACRRIPAHTAVISNLPYGVRLQDRAAANRVFIALDQLLQERSDMRPALVLSTLAPPTSAVGHWKCLATFANGGLRVNALALTAR